MRCWMLRRVLFLHRTPHLWGRKRLERWRWPIDLARRRWQLEKAVREQTSWRSSRNSFRPVRSTRVVVRSGGEAELASLPFYDTGANLRDVLSSASFVKIFELKCPLSRGNLCASIQFWRTSQRSDQFAYAVRDGE